MKRIKATYALGFMVGSLTGFFSPLWYLGFVPLSAGLLFAAYELVEEPDGDAPSTPQA